MSWKEQIIITAIAIPFAVFVILMAMKIDNEQREDDARRTGIPIEQLEHRITRPR